MARHPASVSPTRCQLKSRRGFRGRNNSPIRTLKPRLRLAERLATIEASRPCWGKRNVLGKYLGPTEGRADLGPIAFQIWRCSMRSISPWLLPSCLSLRWKPTPRGEDLVERLRRDCRDNLYGARTAKEREVEPRVHRRHFFCELRYFRALGGQKADKILDGFQSEIEWKGLREGLQNLYTSVRFRPAPPAFCCG